MSFSPHAGNSSAAKPASPSPPTASASTELSPPERFSRQLPLTPARDFTARWCATCRANKKLVFHNDDVLGQSVAKKIAALRGDGTNKDPRITAELARAELPTYAATVQPLRDRLESELLARIPSAERNGHATQRLPNTMNLTFPGIESEALLLLLDQASICASAGSACLADSDEPSHVVRAMKPDSSASRQMVRFSLGTATKPAEIDPAVAAVVRAVDTLRR